LPTVDITSRWHLLLLENALHHASPDAKFPADLEDAVTRMPSPLAEGEFRDA
jgi:hypothetical protein